MANELVPAGGGAVIPASTGGAVSADVGDLSQDTGRETTTAPVTDSPQHLEILRVRSEIHRDLIIEGLGEELVNRCLSVVRDYAPALTAALKAGDTQEQTRIGRQLSQELVTKGLLTHEQLERIRPILQRYNSQAERAFLGPGASNTALIDEMRELDALMAQRESRYWKGPDSKGLQRRWRELHDLGVRADQQRHTAEADLDARIAEIKSWMSARVGSANYGKYWKDRAVQTEYANLLARRR